MPRSRLWSPQQVDQLTGEVGCLLWRHTSEPDPFSTGGEFLDDVDRLVLVETGIPSITPAELVKVEDGFLGYRRRSALGVDEVERIAVAGNFLLITVLERGMSARYQVTRIGICKAPLWMS